jgi:hypothetical protein
MTDAATAGRTFENHVIEHVVAPQGRPWVRPCLVHGFQVDIGLTDSFVIECKNRLDSHQSHRAAAVAWSLRASGWSGLYIVAAPFLPAEETTDRTVLDCALNSGAISHLLLTGDDPTRARIALAALIQKALT